MLKLISDNMYQEKLAGYGIARPDIANYSQQISRAKDQMIANSKAQAIRDLPKQIELISSNVEKIKDQAEMFDTLVVVGIGGPGLGAKVLNAALRNAYTGDIYFTGDTTDPAALSELLDTLQLRKTLFLIISKSGTTIEQASHFVFWREQVIGEVGLDDHKKHFIFITDPESGSLRELAKDQGYQSAVVPPAIGGRFSIMSTIGLVPIALKGADWEKILAGAQSLDDEFSQDDSPIAKSIAEYVLLNHLYAKAGHNITVMTAYSHRLREFVMWYRQLWAESLGKKQNQAGGIVHAGTTAIAGFGPSDQHSQLQLYNEGPNDKIHTLIKIKTTADNFDLPDNYKYTADYAYFKGHNFQEIINLELDTTAYALTKNQRPNCTLELEKLDAFHLGQLLHFCQLIVMMMGELWQIDAFNQPGVELSKNAMYGVLGKAGYEQQRNHFLNFIKPPSVF